MAATDHAAIHLRDRPECASKPRPLTIPQTATTRDAVAAMAERNCGSVVVVDGDSRVSGIVIERDVMKKIVHAGLDARETPLSCIMTREPRAAKETDDVLDWLRIMSNQRFRRLPVVDADGRIKAVFTQGDFVSYTWPDLIRQVGSLVGAVSGATGRCC